MRLAVWSFALVPATIGTAVLAAGALVAVRCPFGTHGFLVGSVTHLMGMLLCLGGYAARPRHTGIRRGVAPLPLDAGRIEATVSSRSRQAHLTGGVQFVRVILAITLLACTVTGLWLARRALTEVATIRRDGRIGQAQVFNRDRLVGPGPSASGLVYYSFRVEGVSVTGQFLAPRTDYPLFYTGRHLAVTYLPGMPRVYRLGNFDAHRASQETSAILLMVLISTAYIGVPVLLVETDLRRQLRLARTGVAATGVITGCKPIIRFGRRIGYHVCYECSFPNGVIVGSARFSQIPGEPTLVGFPLTVLYDTRHPDWSRPLAAFHHITIDRLPSPLLAL